MNVLLQLTNPRVPWPSQGSKRKYFHQNEGNAIMQFKSVKCHLHLHACFPCIGTNSLWQCVGEKKKFHSVSKPVYDEFTLCHETLC